MKMKWLITGLLVCVPVAASAAGDAVHGAEVFKKCSACHNAEKPENKIGPNLVEIIGRRAGTMASYETYSDAMKKAGADGLVWDEQTLAKYLAAPKALVPKNRMPFTGLKSQQDIDDVISYLKAH